MINNIKKDSMIRICILNWNGGADLQDCINSLRLNQSKDFLITVIDNNSSDDSLLELSDDIEIIHLDQNYGFAKGYNIGIQKCITSKDEYIVLLNYDTVIDSDFIQNIIEKINISGSEHIYGVKILYNSNKDFIWYAGGEIDLQRGIISHIGIRESKDKYTLDQKTDYVTGCCMIMHKDIFFKLNGFDERFFMYNEDVDFCLRANSIGIQCQFLSNPIIFHKVSSSVGGNYSIRKMLMKSKSGYQLYRKYYSFYKTILLMLLYTCKSAFRIKSSK